MPRSEFRIERREGVRVLRLWSEDGTNRLTQECVLKLTDAFREVSHSPTPLAIAGNNRFFSAGADLAEISALEGPSGYEFSKMGQTLMRLVEEFPAPVYAAISGYCMGGGLDLALACHHRIASPNTLFGHRGAALGLITGWGGTQRLPRLIGKGRALEMLVAAEKVAASRAREIGLIDAIAVDPVAEVVHRMKRLAL
ncbi:MAG TPA: enoyl-CoA hydratase/isomerase family protein [Candidatus Acidoferrum sp.]|nr:enoyl-CoA hydratase/isomerase family protein [Candidatus Acidoferrum sp.]